MLPLNQALPIFEDNLADIRRACIENVTQCIEENSPYAIQDIDKPFTVEAIMLHLNYMRIQQVSERLFKTVRRIDSYRHFKANPNTNLPVSDIDIQNAREVGEDWFIYEAGLSTRKPHRGQCPFHPDQDPSLMLMKSKKRGTYYLKCFPCSQAWDAPGFLMARDGIDFIEAVKRIVS